MKESHCCWDFFEFLYFQGVIICGFYFCIWCLSLMSFLKLHLGIKLQALAMSGILVFEQGLFTFFIRRLHHRTVTSIIQKMMKQKNANCYAFVCVCLYVQFFQVFCLVDNRSTPAVKYLFYSAFHSTMARHAQQAIALR